MSPPTRDIDQKPRPNDDQIVLREIERLHNELITCLKQIETISETAKKGERYNIDCGRLIEITLKLPHVTLS